MADHLTANLAGITQVSGSLRVLGDEFAAITQVADVGGAAGSAELAAALTNFATGWSDKRNALIGELRNMSGLAAQAVAEYTRTDDTLARALPGGGAGWHREQQRRGKRAAAVSQDWWPLSDADPVPGDPDTLAALGKHMADAAAEIERMASTLPRICASETWDSDAGEQFRVRAASTAASIGRTHRRFFTVARALGRSTYGGSGYAAQLQEHQEKAAAALAAVNGTAGTSGSEADRRRAWTQLLDATNGADPTRPLPQPPTDRRERGVPGCRGSPGCRAGGSRDDGRPDAAGEPRCDPPVPAGVLRRPGGRDDAQERLQRRDRPAPAAARAVASAAADQAADAHAAAQLILTAIDNDGLNNPSGFLHWLDSTVDSVRGFAASHWAQYVSDLANVAGVIASVCGVIALVLAFIPGMQEFAAAFETMALLAQAVAFCCHALLFATGHGSLLDVAVDAVGLVTFGVGKGLIGGAEATAEISETASSAYRAVAGDGKNVADVIEAGSGASKAAMGIEGVKLTAKMAEQVKEAASVSPVFRAAMKAWQDGKVGNALGKDAVGTLGRGLKAAAGLGSAEIGSALSNAVEAGDAMPYAKGVTWALTSRIESYQALFRITQGTGLGTDAAGKLDSTFHYFHEDLPGYDNLGSALPHGQDG